jgi:ParB-like nuclease domain
MKIISRRLDSIVPYDRNPRQNDAAVAAVAASIKEFGFRQPIVVDEQDVIVVGHARYLAAIHLGLTTVPVHVAKDLSPEQVRAYRLADNKTAELAEWDNDLLAAEIAALSGGGIDLTSFGFDEEAVAAAVHAVTSTATVGQSSKALMLKFGKYSVPMDETEFGKLVAALSSHEAATGSKYGFVMSLFPSEASDVPSGVAVHGDLPGK